MSEIIELELDRTEGERDKRLGVHEITFGYPRRESYIIFRYFVNGDMLKEKMIPLTELLK